MLIVDSEWVGCGGILPRIPFKELLLLSPAHDGTATRTAFCAAVQAGCRSQAVDIRCK